MKKSNVVKMPKPIERLPQLNVPVTPDVKQEVKIACAIARMSIKEWGAKVLEYAAKQQIKEGKFPFESLLTPSSNNALTDETKPSNIIRLTDGVVAQLVEHHNGIVGGSKDGTSTASAPADHVLSLLSVVPTHNGSDQKKSGRKPDSIAALASQPAKKSSLPIFPTAHANSAAA